MEKIMRQLKLILIGVALIGAFGANAAWANGGHFRGGGHGGGHGHWHGNIGFFVGAPLFWYPSPYYYYPPAVVTVPAAPTVYIEQAPPSAPPAQQYWYYCGNPQGYYPNVKECPGGWQKVLPQPAR
jgi:hypothetical protein